MSLVDDISQLNNALATILALFAPFKVREIKYTHSAPWYNNSLRLQKTTWFFFTY